MSRILDLRPIEPVAASCEYMCERPGHTALERGQTTMTFRLMSMAFAIWIVPVAANAQLTIEMANIRCEQYLAMTPSQSRDSSAWMSGWFSYQLGKTTLDLVAHQKNIENVKAWCQYHPRETVMSGLKNATGVQGAFLHIGESP